MSQILTQPKYFELESAAFICSLRLQVEKRMQFALSGGFAVTLIRGQDGEPPLADHIEYLVDSKNLALAEAIFREDTEVNGQRALDVLDEKLIVKIYKASAGPTAVIVKFVPLGQRFYPWQLTFGASDSQREPTIYSRDIRGREETKQFPVVTPKYLLYHLIASFHLPPTTEDDELNSKRSTYTQINVCLEAAASSVLAQTTSTLRQLYMFDIVQALFLRERVLALIEYASLHARRFTAVQIGQWATMGVAMTEADLTRPLGNNNIDQETWFTAWDGM